MRTLFLALVILLASPGFAEGPTIDITEADGCADFVAGWPLKPYTLVASTDGPEDDLIFTVEKARITIKTINPDDGFMIHIEKALPSLVMSVVHNDGYGQVVTLVDFTKPDGVDAFEQAVGSLRAIRTMKFIRQILHAMMDLGAPYYETTSMRDSLINAAFYLSAMWFPRDGMDLYDKAEMLTYALADCAFFNEKMNNNCYDPTPPE